MHKSNYFFIMVFVFTVESTALINRIFNDLNIRGSVFQTKKKLLLSTKPPQK